MSSLQDRDNKIKFYIRPFPCVDFDWECLKFDINRKIIYIKHMFEPHSTFRQPSTAKFWCFPTNGIFFNCCQDEVYRTSTDGIFERIYRGCDNVIISYGQNYSGKSFTLSGLLNAYQLRGIIPRFLVDLFEEQKVKRDKYDFNVWISITDIHGSLLFDLLSNPKMKRGTYKDIASVQIHSSTEGLKLLFKAEKQRMIVDNMSYNSHVASNIVTFTVKVKPLNAHDPVNKVSKMHFVDLAGVETIERNPLTSFKERGNQGKSNISKTLLEIHALRSNRYTSKDGKFSANQRIHNVTQYLRNSLKYSSNIRLICHIRPTMFDLQMSMSLLKFGKSFQNIRTGSPKPYVEINIEKTLEHLQEKVTTLQDQLMLRKLLGDTQPITISQDRIDFVKRAVKSFLKGHLREYELTSLVDDYGLILNITRIIHQDLKLGKNVHSASQTDEERKGLNLIDSEDTKQSEIPQIAIRQSLTNEQSSHKPSKKVSFNKSKKESKKSSGTKTANKKGSRKSNEQEKLFLESVGVQVNLTEPLAKLPDINSREGLWAMFLINNPDAQNVIDEFDAEVKEKEKQLNVEKSRYDDIGNSINKLNLNLKQLKSLRHTEGKETYDNNGKLIIPEDESKVAKQLQHMTEQEEMSKRKLTEAKLDWLESLEKLEKTKKQIENDFRKFCLAENLLELDVNETTQDEKHNDNEKYQMKSEENLVELVENTRLQEVFEMYQSKYWKTVMKSR